MTKKIRLYQPFGDLGCQRPAITLVRQLVLYVPLLLILNRVFGFGGMIWAQPCTEVIMMAVSVVLLYRVISSSEAGNGQ